MRDLRALAVHLGPSLLAAAVCFLPARAAASAEATLRLAEIPPGARLPAAINADRVNVRPGPGAEPPLGQLSKGARVVARRRDGAWVEIDYPADLGLWVASRYVKPLSGGELQSASSASPVRASALRDRVQVRSLPSTRGAVVAELSRGDEITVIGVFNDWCRVSPLGPGPLGRLVAYVHADYVDILSEAGPPAGGAATPSGPPERSPPGVDSTRKPGAQEALSRAAAMLRPDRPLELADARAALRLLDEALSSASGAELERARAAAAEILGRLPPAKWLALLELAAASRPEPPEDIDRRFAARLRDARDALQETPPIEFTARGTLRASGPDGSTYRLVRGETVLYEISPLGADLTPFVGKEVGVVGRLTEPRREGGVPRIDVRYIEEIGR